MAGLDSWLIRDISDSTLTQTYWWKTLTKLTTQKLIGKNVLTRFATHRLMTKMNLFNSDSKRGIQLMNWRLEFESDMDNCLVGLGTNIIRISAILKNCVGVKSLISIASQPHQYQPSLDLWNWYLITNTNYTNLTKNITFFYHSNHAISVAN